MEINPNSKSYRGVPIIRLSIDKEAFSFRIIYLGDNVNIIDTFNYEYGHSIQMGKMNPIGYTLWVFIPSVTCYWLQRNEILPDSYSYYSVPWEYQANLYGGAYKDYKYAPGTEDAFNKYKIIAGE